MRAWTAIFHMINIKWFHYNQPSRKLRILYKWHLFRNGNGNYKSSLVTFTRCIKRWISTSNNNTFTVNLLNTWLVPILRARTTGRMRSSTCFLAQPNRSLSRFFGQKSVVLDTITKPDTDFNTTIGPFSYIILSIHEWVCLPGHFIYRPNNLCILTIG